MQIKMRSTRLALLAARRRTLVAESNALRDRLDSDAGDVRRSLSVARLGLSAWRSLSRHPLLVAGVAAAVLIIKPRRLIRAGGMAISAIVVLRRMKGLAAWLRSGSSERS
jgi:hypothetical protein